MKRIALLLLAVFTLGACERKDEPNKILDGYPAGTSEVVLPADAARQFLLLQRDLLKILVPVISKFQNDQLTLSELTDLGGGLYSFEGVNRFYGAATFTLEFKNSANATIDPVPTNNRAVATDLLTVTITGTAASTEYPTITENLVLHLSSAGWLTGVHRLTGSASFSGSSYGLTFQLDPTGARATFDGLTDNVVTVTGTGGTPPATTALTLAFNSDRSANGPISWEGREGSIHLEDNGSGFIVEPAGRILLE